MGGGSSTTFYGLGCSTPLIDWDNNEDEWVEERY